MTTRSLPQKHCRDLTDHPAHDHGWNGASWNHRCPGRHTPSAHRAPHPSPAVPSDPFAGIDENTEFDATRPAVS